MPPPWPTVLTTRSLASLATVTLALAPEPEPLAKWRTGADGSTPVKASAVLSTERLTPDNDTWTSWAPTGGATSCHATDSVLPPHGVPEIEVTRVSATPP